MEKLIKITDDHYVVVDNSEIKEGDWCIHNKEMKQAIGDVVEFAKKHSKKITHSTQPLEYFFTDPKNSSKVFRFDKVKYISLQEVKELIGEVDVVKKANKYISNYSMTAEYHNEYDYIAGYNQSLEDNKEKKYTEEDMRKAHHYGLMDEYGKFDEFIQSLQPKTQWVIEIVNGKLKLL